MHPKKKLTPSILYFNTKVTYNNKRIEYISKFPKTELAAYFLTLQVEDTLLKYFDRIQKSTLNKRYFGKRLKQQYLGLTKIKEGMKVPSFEGFDVYGKKIQLNDYKGKYLLLDFWGSWCGPCLSEIPKLKEFIAANNDKVEVLGIAIWDKKQDLQNAIKKHSIPWKNILNSSTSKNDLTLLFNIHFAPVKFLISPDGILLKMFNKEDDEFELNSFDEYLK